LKINEIVLELHLINEKMSKEEEISKFFIHNYADCQSQAIGEGTTIWQFCVVLKDALIGRNCNICANVFIENDVIIGDNTTIKCGVQIWDGLRLGNNVFIGPNVTFTNDKYPRSKKYPKSYPQTYVEDSASIGANATILPGIRIGKNSMVAAGSVVTRDVQPNTLVKGSPAIFSKNLKSNKDV